MLHAVENTNLPFADASVVSFFFILFVGACTVFLVFDMVRRIRRANFREQIAAKLDAEVAEEQAIKKAHDSK